MAEIATKSFYEVSTACDPAIDYDPVGVNDQNVALYENREAGISAGRQTYSIKSTLATEKKPEDVVQVAFVTPLIRVDDNGQDYVAGYAKGFITTIVSDVAIAVEKAVLRKKMQLSLTGPSPALDLIEHGTPIW